MSRVADWPKSRVAHCCPSIETYTCRWRTSSGRLRVTVTRALEPLTAPSYSFTGIRSGLRIAWRQSHVLSELLLDCACHLRVLLEEGFRVLPALAKPLAFVREPRAALLDNLSLGTLIDEIALARDALAVHDVEL